MNLSNPEFRCQSAVGSRRHSAFGSKAGPGAYSYSKVSEFLVPYPRIEPSRTPKCLYTCTFASETVPKPVPAHTPTVCIFKCSKVSGFLVLYLRIDPRGPPKCPYTCTFAPETGPKAGLGVYSYCLHPQMLESVRITYLRIVPLSNRAELVQVRVLSWRLHRLLTRARLPRAAGQAP